MIIRYLFWHHIVIAILSSQELVISDRYWYFNVGEIKVQSIVEYMFVEYYVISAERQFCPRVTVFRGMLSQPFFRLPVYILSTL